MNNNQSPPRNQDINPEYLMRRPLIDSPPRLVRGRRRTLRELYEDDDDDDDDNDNYIDDDWVDRLISGIENTNLEEEERENRIKRESEEKVNNILNNTREVPIEKSLTKVSNADYNSASAFDLINLSDENVKKYLEENKEDHIAFKFGRIYYLSKKSVLSSNELLKDNIRFSCKEATGVIPEENVLTTEPLFTMKSIGIPGAVIPYGQVRSLLRSRDKQLFEIVGTTISYPSTVSILIYYGLTGWVSGAHCQEGQDEKKYELKYIKVEDELKGGARKKNKNKTHTRKSIRKSMRKSMRRKKRTIKRKRN